MLRDLEILLVVYHLELGSHLKHKLLQFIKCNFGKTHSLWDLILQPGIEPGPSTVPSDSPSPNHWTTRELSKVYFKMWA